MADQAKVASIDSLESFRNSLVIFMERVSKSIEEVGDTVRRTKHWVQDEQYNYWISEKRRRERKLEQAEQELYSSRLSTLQDASTEAQMNVRRANRAIEEVEEKIKLIKKIKNEEQDIHGYGASTKGNVLLQFYNINTNDVVVGIAASGTTPYVIGALENCQKQNITTACIACNQNSPLSKVADFPIEIVVGPEFVTGSTRMKAGTAQKLVLNMISTAVMIKLGKVKGNKMVDMQLSNNKLVDRGAKMIMQETGVSYQKAEQLLSQYGSVRKAVDNYNG